MIRNKKMCMLLIAYTGFGMQAHAAQSNTGVSYLNETWFSLSADACTGNNDEALRLNNGSDILNLASSGFSCSVSYDDNDLIYTITWQKGDYDRDRVKDTFSFDVRVSGFSGSRFAYTEEAGKSSMTRLGKSDIINVWKSDADAPFSVWDIANDNISGQTDGQSLTFSIENSTVSANGYSAKFNGFNFAVLAETEGNHSHRFIQGSGNRLNSGNFSADTSELEFEPTEKFVITGAGDGNTAKSWGVSRLDFSFSITNPTLATIWEARDLSVQGTGPSYSPVYPAEASARKKLFPKSSWDTVPRWLAVRNARRYTDEQIEAIANNYQLVMLEKANQSGFDTVDEGIKDTAARLKAINPNIKTIFYWNTVIQYTGYSSDDEFEQNFTDWSEYDENGDLVMFKDTFRRYDETNKDFRSCWVNLPVKVAKDENIDGVFIDKMPKAAVDELFINGRPVSDYVGMINTLKDKLPEDKLLMGNNLRGERQNGSRAMMELLDGSYLERWDIALSDYDFPSQTRADAVSLSMQLMREALARGKFITFQSGRTAEDDGLVFDSYQDKVRYMKKNLDYPLAIFLIIAEKNAFFSYQQGVNANPGAEEVWDSTFIDELTRSLGEPLGDPVKNGYIFTRSYENVDVWLDLETEKATLTWHNID